MYIENFINIKSVINLFPKNELKYYINIIFTEYFNHCKKFKVKQKFTIIKLLLQNIYIIINLFYKIQT